MQRPVVISLQHSLTEAQNVVHISSKFVGKRLMWERFSPFTVLSRFYGWHEETKSNEKYFSTSTDVGHETISRQTNLVESSSPNDSLTTINTTAHHPPHHYLDGGMPCDPKPKPFFLAEYGEESLHSLILLRHGESEWNSQNRYTGW
jgi:hypothetical protein